MKRQLTKGSGVCLRNAGHIYAEDGGVYKRQDRAEVGLGKGIEPLLEEC